MPSNREKLQARLWRDVFGEKGKNALKKTLSTSPPDGEIGNER
jgi:hypothetical protein